MVRFVFDDHLDLRLKIEDCLGKFGARAIRNYPSPAGTQTVALAAEGTQMAIPNLE